MTTLKNTSFIDSELSTRKSKSENKEDIVNAGIGVRYIFAFLGKNSYQN